MKKKSFPITNIGSVSLLMIFIVLCMVTFAVLSLSETISDKKFSVKMAKHTTQYYEASNLAEAKLSEIDQILSDSHKEAKDSAGYDKLVRERLKNISDIDTDASSKNYIISSQFVINDSLSLEMRLSVNGYDDTKKQYYKILSFKEIHTQEWNGDNTLNLIH